MRFVTKCFIGLTIGLLTLSAQAADPAGAQFSVFDFNAPDVKNVEGVRLAAIYGKSGSVTGIDFAIGLSELDSVKGVSFPLWIGANRVHNEMTGVAIGIFNWHEGEDKGLNLGFVNYTKNVNGVNWGAVNVSTGTTLVDLSLVNVSKESTFQLAWVNKTDKLNGLQIGLLNCADNGFLRCFPLFNFPKSSSK